MKRNILADCDLGDWVDWRDYPYDKDSIGIYQRSIQDFVEGSKENTVTILAPVEWDFVRAWVCVRKGRP